MSKCRANTVSDANGFSCALFSRRTATSGSMGPAGRMMLGFILPGLNRTTSLSFMWKRRLNDNPSCPATPVLSLIGPATAASASTITCTSFSINWAG